MTNTLLTTLGAGRAALLAATLALLGASDKAIAQNTPILTIDPTVLFDSFEGTPGEPTVVTTQASATSSTLHATEGTHSLQVTLNANQSFPGIRFNFSPQKNWSTYPAIAMDVYNPQSTPLSLSIRMDDPSGTTTTRTGTLTLPPLTSTTALFAFMAPSPAEIGLKAASRLPGYGLGFSGGKALAGTNISTVIVYAPTTGSSTSETLYFDNIRLVQGDPAKTGRQNAMDLLYRGIVDTYGQFTKETWPGKITQDSDLATNPTLPSPPSDRDQYGGGLYLSGYGTTGFFHTTKLSNGTWWLVDPSGSLFFSIGVDSVGAAADASNTYRARVLTYVGVPGNISPAPDARYPWFTSLPSSTDPLATYYAHGTGEGHYCDATTSNVNCAYDFFSANLQRKFGTSNFIDAWDQEAVDRLTSWGFNTIGDFSDPVLAQTPGSTGNRVPYTLKTIIDKTAYTNIAVSITGNSGGQIADPFDPRFEPAMESAITATQNQASNNNPTQIINDPWLIGYFVDNEMPWASEHFLTTAPSDGSKDSTYFPVIFGILKAPYANEAKKYWVLSVLTPEYGNNIALLNSAWGTSYASFDAIRSTTTVPAMTAAMRTDFSTFLGIFAQKYYGSVAQAVHAKDANHLYLGSKYHVFTPEVVNACGQYCDVISFDIYDTEVAATEYSPLLSGTNKPALAAEYHFGATDRGGFSGGLGPVDNQAARGTAYDTYVRSVYANPIFIGAHWYEYQDEMITGRQADGENYAIGLVNITDQPYPELTTAARTTNGDVYNTTNGGRSH